VASENAAIELAIFGASPTDLPINRITLGHLLASAPNLPR
jgi:hypothetical protein